MGSSLRISGRALAPHQGHLHAAGPLTLSNRESLEEREVHEGTVNQMLALPLSGMRPNRRPLFVFGGCFRGIKGPLLSLKMVNRLNGWLHFYVCYFFLPAASVKSAVSATDSRLQIMQFVALVCLVYVSVYDLALACFLMTFVVVVVRME